ncbi:liver-expressed antimicrobial peptide 2-like [Xyrauchen texanus]|uniref:liver-expressed antimicrobial peptide 2-like n=1 Tax=Xyrauchen texanus TaxID=154827 RepID=UPI002241C76D|nr:liver-expressed antimicrobial peptide 2-like [Xyrauchen texanus]
MTYDPLYQLIISSNINSVHLIDSLKPLANMLTTNHWLIVPTLLVSLLFAVQVQSAPVDSDWATGLIHRAKRSLLWRWNTLKPVGSGCRDHYECGTNYCRKHACSFKSQHA